jgi:hypothetical protein
VDYFATKYDSAAAEVISILSDYSEGFGKAQDGDVEAPTGFFALVILDDTCDLAFDDHTNYPLGDYAGEVARTYGVTADDVMGAHIVTTNSQGFVSVQTFATTDEAHAHYAELEAAYSTWLDSDEEV